VMNPIQRGVLGLSSHPLRLSKNRRELVAACRLFDLEGERRHDLVRIAAWG
jgi:hypothetical protein